MPENFTVDEARAVVADALTNYIQQIENGDTDDVSVRDLHLAKAMAENVSGWTHTTRVRDFVKRLPLPLIDVLENAGA